MVVVSIVGVPVVSVHSGDICRGNFCTDNV